MAHRACRDQALDTLRFPYREFRAGQRQLAEAVYKAVCTGTHLMAQAPTGIGKTLATLFPPLKAFPGQKLDKLFFLTAKTPGRRLALDALSRLAPSDAPLALRVLELVARDKACEHPDKACHGESCPLARAFYDRLPAARAAALSRPHLTQAALREIALQHQVCPYYLGQEMARWADVVIGDYNYYFDVSALLHGLTQANQWRICVLVDEAHNLLERGRSMYSASLDFRNFKDLPSSSPEVLKKSLRRILRCWRELHAEQSTSYVVHSQLPGKLILALQQAISAITEYLGEHPSGLDPALQNAYFEATHFCRIAELFGEHSLFDCSAPAERRPAVGPVHPQRATGALSGATLAAGARRRAVLRNAQPTAVLRRYAGLAGEQRMARSAVAVQRRAVAGPTRAAHLDALRAPQRLAAGSGAVAGPPVPGAPGQLPGVLQQFRLPAAGQRHAGRTASGPAVLGADARHG